MDAFGRSTMMILGFGLCSIACGPPPIEWSGYATTTSLGDDDDDDDDDGDGDGGDTDTSDTDTSDIEGDDTEGDGEPEPDDTGPDPGDTGGDDDGLCAGACGTAGCGACPEAAIVDGGWFQIDATEVTVAAYADFQGRQFDPAVLAPGCEWKPQFGWFQPDSWAQQIDADPDHPVTGVDWCDAHAYCTWANKRLCGVAGGAAASLSDANTPTNEWFAACSANDSQSFCYGADYQPLACNGEAQAIGAITPVASLLSCEGGFAQLWDMSGNVWEWTSACAEQPGLDAQAQLCRRRGGSYHSANELLRCDADSKRARSYRATNTGFRCCSS